MNDQTLIAYGPLIIFVFLGVVAPLASCAIAGICHWLDDGEKSFPYPWPYKYLPWIAVLKDNDYREFYLCAGKLAMYLLAALILLPILGWLCQELWLAGVSVWTTFILPLTIIIGVLYTAKKVLRLGKRVNKHINDKGVHKG